MRKILPTILTSLILFSSISSQTLFDIVTSGTPEELEKTIKAGANVNEKDSLGRTPLMIASKSNQNPEVIKILIKAGANVNERNSEGRTPLMSASASNQNPEITETLIKAGANVNDRTPEGVTPLMLTAYNNTNPEVIETLIKAGANVNEKDSLGRTPLMIASESNQNPEVIEILIKAGANVNDRTLEGWTPLMIASKSNQNPEVIKILIKAGANVNERNSEGWTPLIFASESNQNPEVIETLIKAGANVNERNSEGWTPLMFASASNQNPEIIETLIKAGANINEMDFLGRTLMMIASAFSQNPKVIEILIKAGANVNERDSNGRTPLTSASVGNQNPEVIETLIKAGAKVNERDSEGWTSLMFASFVNQNPEIIEILIKAGANVNDRTLEGWTPLMIASEYNQNHEVIETLIRAGANVNDRTLEGWTPLMIASALNQNPEVITVLLKYGADRKLRDNNGYNAFIHAIMNENLKDNPIRLELLMNEQDFKNYFLQNINTLDPIEGIWTISIEDVKYIENKITDSEYVQNLFKIAITKNEDKYDCHVFETDGQYPKIKLQKTASFSNYLVDIKMDSADSRYTATAIFDGNSSLKFEYNWNEGDIRRDYEKILTDDEEISRWTYKTTITTSFKLLKIYPTIDDKKDLYTGSATCFAISNKGYFVTNYHVIANAKTIMIRGINGNYNKSHRANIVNFDKNNDLAILKISPDSIKILGSIPFSINSKISNIGESVYVLGYPLRATMGDEIKLTNGIISSKTGFQGDVSCYQVSAPVQSGNSGAPIFNTKGELIGIISGKHLEAENVSYGIKSSYLLSLIDVLPEKIEFKKSQEPTFQGYSLSKQAEIMKRFIYIVEVF